MNRQANNFIRMVGGGSEPRERQLSPGEQETRRDLEQRLKDEPPLSDPRMGQDEWRRAGKLAGELSPEEQVEIQ